MRGFFFLRRAGGPRGVEVGGGVEAGGGGMEVEVGVGGMGGRGCGERLEKTMR